MSAALPFDASLIPSRTSSLQNKKSSTAGRRGLASNRLSLRFELSTNALAEAGIPVQTYASRAAASASAATRRLVRAQAQEENKNPSSCTSKQPPPDSTATTACSSRPTSKRWSTFSGFADMQPIMSPASRASVILPARPAGVRRWDGNGKYSIEWDGLRRDVELWLPDGDCFVHLYEKGCSRRGPSFCVPMLALQESHCGMLFSLCFAQTISRAEVPLSQLDALDTPPEQMYELYIPAPEGSTREEALQHHLTTRNFFAFIFRKPLVGTHLGSALIELQDRLHVYRTPEISLSNYDALRQYAEAVGYLDFTDRPDNALALLLYAEHFQLKSLWIDAYAHCVGMNETLFLSPEYDNIPRVSKALITRAYLEMDLHLGRVSKALSNFLEDSLSPTYLGLPHGARSHLERFRSFLHSFYVDKYGYWPPPKSSHFPKALYRSMYFDFRGLYDLIVDLDSSASLQDQKPADGGICVLQTLQAFDKRHKYTPLPHPLPLIPTIPSTPGRSNSQRNLVALTLNHKQAKTDKQLLLRAALTASTNSKNTSVASSPLVKAYKRFERDCLDVKEKVSLSDARKVRWILIYAILQMLVSVTRAPLEVRDTDEASYPLCCLTAGTPPWKGRPKKDSFSSKARDSCYVSTEGKQMDVFPAGVDKPLPQTPSPSSFAIRPDCEINDYITHTNVGNPNSSCASRRRSRNASPIEMPAPLFSSSSAVTPTSAKRQSAPIPTRSASWRSALSPFSSRRNSTVLKATPQRLAFCEIQVPGYGNGLNETVVDEPARPENTRAGALAALTGHGRSASSSTVIRRVPPGKLVLNTTCLPISEEKERRTPTLESFQLDSWPSPSDAPPIEHHPAFRSSGSSSSSSAQPRSPAEEAAPAPIAATETISRASGRRPSASTGSSHNATSSDSESSAHWSPARSSSSSGSSATTMSTPSTPTTLALFTSLRTAHANANIDSSTTPRPVSPRVPDALDLALPEDTDSMSPMSPVSLSPTSSASPGQHRPRKSSSVYDMDLAGLDDLVPCPKPRSRARDAKARHLLGLDDSEKEVDQRQVVSIYQALVGGPYGWV